MPAAIVAKLNEALVEIVEVAGDPEAVRQLGLRPMNSTPAELGAYMKTELVRWGKVVEAAGAKGVE